MGEGAIANSSSCTNIKSTITNTPTKQKDTNELDIKSTAENLLSATNITDSIATNYVPKSEHAPTSIAETTGIQLAKNANESAKQKISITIPSTNELEASIFAGLANITTARRVKTDITSLASDLGNDDTTYRPTTTANSTANGDPAKDCSMGMVQWRDVDEGDECVSYGLPPADYPGNFNSGIRVCPCCMGSQPFAPTYQGYPGYQPMPAPQYQYPYHTPAFNHYNDYARPPPAPYLSYQNQKPVHADQFNSYGQPAMNYCPSFPGASQWTNLRYGSGNMPWMNSYGRCCLSFDEYNGYARRRPRRCRREYFFQAPRGRCRTSDERDQGSRVEKEIQETSEPSFRTERIELEDTPVPTLARVKTTRTPLKSTPKSTTTTTPVRIPRVTTTRPPPWPTHYPIGFRLQKSSGNSPFDLEETNVKAIFDRQASSKTNVSVIEDSEDEAEARRMSTILERGERLRLESQPSIAETAASMMRKRHNEILKQELEEMLEQDIGKLNQTK